MSDLKAKSFSNNIKRVTDKLSDKELLDLSNYLAYGFIDTEFTDSQKVLLDELFGINDWLSFVQDERRERIKKSFFRTRPWFDLDEYRSHILFEISKRFTLRIHKLDLVEKQLELANINLKIEKTKTELLKNKLNEAVLDSYEDGVFSKIEGWCNVYDVLTDEGLLNLEE